MSSDEFGQVACRPNRLDLPRVGVRSVGPVQPTNTPYPIVKYTPNYFQNNTFLNVLEVEV